MIIHDLSTLDEAWGELGGAAWPREGVVTYTARIELGKGFLRVLTSVPRPH